MITLSGILSYSMGNFLCLRGTASFKLLSKISEPNPAVQRDLIELHKHKMVDFLNSGEYRFFPEVILSVGLTDKTANMEEIENLYNSLYSGETWNSSIDKFKFSMTKKEVKLSNANLGSELKPIFTAQVSFDETIKLTRIDGNHRLSAADSVIEEFPAPFCLILFRTDSENLQFSRAIFHNINAKQIPLNLEENFKVIIEGEDVFPDDKLKNDPSFGWEYYLARKSVKELDLQYFSAIATHISKSKFTFFVELYSYLIKTCNIEKNEEAYNSVKTSLTKINQALVDSNIINVTSNLAVLNALVFYFLTDKKKYNGFLSWIKKNNIGNIEYLHVEDVINLYDEIYKHVPKKVFLARWYPSETDDEYTSSVHRLTAIKEVANELNFELVDLGTRDTGTFDIRSVMYHDIRECDIFIADLTGARHNVMVEVGYALRYIDAGRMLFYFKKTENCKTVPFDVSGFSFDTIEDSNEINTKVKPRLQRILNDSIDAII